MGGGTLPGFGFKFWYELVANLAVAGLAAVGWILTVLPWTRVAGLRVLGGALMLDILFNQFSTFEFSQFNALIGFGVELVILVGIRYLLRTKQIPHWGRRTRPGPAVATSVRGRAPAPS